MTKSLTEAQLIQQIRAGVDKHGVRGYARMVGANPADVHRIATGRHGIGRVVPAAMGYEVRFVKKT